MIIYPSNPQQWSILATFLHKHTGVHPSADLKLVAWLDPVVNQLRLVVGMNGFIGKVCQMHVAMQDYSYTPREMLQHTFHCAFNEYGCEKILGVVNSKNEKAMRYDLHLGFKEEHRLPGMHDDGGDIVLLSMTREACRYLVKPKLDDVSLKVVGGTNA